MSLKAKLIVGLLLLAMAFGGGYWKGYNTPRDGVDPQDYIETVFTPYGDGIGTYLSFLDKAHKSVYIADFSFTDERIADKLVELKTKRKVDVHVVLDKSQTEGWSGDKEKTLIAQLRAAGIEVVIGDSDKRHDLMHNKFTILDEIWVESGSWNYTKAANDQDNVLDFIKSSKRAKLFRETWDRIYAFMKQDEARKQQPPPPKKKKSH